MLKPFGEQAELVTDSDIDETSSLMSKSSKSVPGDLEENSGRDDNLAHDPHHINIRGVALFSKVEFWQLWLMLGLLTGIGLMTIKYAMRLPISDLRSH